MNTNIWSHSPVVAIWAGSLTLLCFAGGLLLNRKWTAAIAVAVSGPIVLLPMAFAGGLGALTLGEIFIRGALSPLGLGTGAEAWVRSIADAVMLLTPFAMLTLYLRYERSFKRSERASERRVAARMRERNFSLTNCRSVLIERRKNSAPKFVFPRRKSRHHERAGKRMALPKLPRRLARHPRPTGRPVPLPHPHPRGE